MLIKIMLITNSSVVVTDLEENFNLIDRKFEKNAATKSLAVYGIKSELYLKVTTKKEGFLFH